ncbi:MAG: cytochrome c peroxidase [Planctomycetota bacterium]
MQMSTSCAAILVLLHCLICSTAVVGQLPPVPFPAENPPTEEKRILGKILFWDEQLSSDDTVACGTCHRAGAGGSDPRLGAHPGPDGLFGTSDDIIGSPGVARADLAGIPLMDPLFGFDVQVTGRSAQPVIGSQWAPDMFWDGRATSTFIDPQTGLVSIASGGALESQAVGPLLSDVEMAFEGRTWDDLVTKMETVAPLALGTDLPADVAAILVGGTDYPDLFDAAFGSSGITAERIAFAIATYERTLVPDQTPFDLGTLTPQQQAGFNVLTNSTVCLNCHVPPLFTDNQFYNIGLRPADDDLGRFNVTGDVAHRGRFKTPTLRNVGLRPAQMHVGWVMDVQDAIDYYNAPAWPSVDPLTGHTQFTAEQTPIPVPGAPPGAAPIYNDIFMPPQIQPAVIEFLSNGLTDPRVANETFPFDRPTLQSELPDSVEFVRGDCNTDGVLDLSDAVTVLTVLFPPPMPPTMGCEDACDGSDDGVIDIADAIALLSWMFGFPAVPLPAPTSCGPDPTTAETLECSIYPNCP